MTGTVDQARQLPGGAGPVPGVARQLLGVVPPITGVAQAAFEDVVVAYRERIVLRGVSLAIAPGELVALVGPNGAGKSTLLRVLAGLVVPRSGRAFLGGDPVDSLDRPAIARRLAAVPGQATLPFSARVEEVVALGRLPHEDPFRGPRAADRAAVDAAISRVGIDRLRGRDARELSLGERQLVLVALAVAQAAPLLVLDEPTAHLDLRHQVAVMELLADLNAADGTTVLAVLHDLTLARHFFPRLVVLDGGRIVADGPPSAVLTRERVRSVFGVDVALTGVAASVALIAASDATSAATSAATSPGAPRVDRAHSGG